MYYHEIKCPYRVVSYHIQAQNTDSLITVGSFLIHQMYAYTYAYNVYIRKRIRYNLSVTPVPSQLPT